MKILYVAVINGLLMLSICVNISAQKRDEVDVDYAFVRLAMQPLPADIKTYKIITKLERGEPGLPMYVGEITEGAMRQGISMPEAQFEDRQVVYEDKYLTLDNYQRENTVADVIVELYLGTITVKDFKEAKGSEFKRANGSIARGYLYQYTFPATLTIKRNDSEVIFQEVIFSNEQVQRENYSQGNHFFVGKYNIADETHFKLMEVLAKRTFKRAGKIIDDFLVPKNVVAKLEVKSFTSKDFDYSDLNNAKNLLTEGIKSLGTDIDAAQNNIKSSIEIYQKALTEFKDDKKARINVKVQEDLKYNVALAYYLLNDFTNAKAQLQGFVKAEEPEEQGKEPKKKGGGFLSKIVKVSIGGETKAFFEDLFDRKEKLEIKAKKHQDLYELITDTEKRYRTNGKI